MRLKPKSPEDFDNVYGADCFIRHFPALFTDGVEVERVVGETRVGPRVFYYILVDGKMYGESWFFTGKEVQKYMKRC